MRIIGGLARGIRLDAGPQEAVRPTTDRIKETLFNILGDVEGRTVIDFFAGSGSLGLEALSRGAEKVYFVEKDPRTCRIIKSNLQKVEKSLGIESEAEILSCGYRQALHKIRHKADLILADPPYGDNCSMAADFLKNNGLKSVAGDSAVLALEHTAGFVIPEGIPWEQFRRKDFGTTAFTFWELKENV